MLALQALVEGNGWAASLAAIFFAATSVLVGIVIALGRLCITTLRIKRATLWSRALEDHGAKKSTVAGVLADAARSDISKVRSKRHL